MGKKKYHCQNKQQDRQAQEDPTSATRVNAAEPSKINKKKNDKKNQNCSMA